MSPRLALLLAAAAVPAGLATPVVGQFAEPITVIHEIRGEAAGDEFGWIARRIADADGDGVADFCTSAPTKAIDDRKNAGRVYVYSGRTGTLLWKTDGSAGARLGINVDSAGDVNGDGAGDVIAGAPGISAAFIFSGKDGRVLHWLKGERPGAWFGRTVAPAGDVDDDGRDDVLVGAPRHPDAETATGRVSLISGADGSVLRTFDGAAPGDTFGSTLHGFSDGALLFTKHGEAAGDGFGIGDGHDDLIIGAWQHGSGAPSGGLSSQPGPSPPRN